MSLEERKACAEAARQIRAHLRLYGSVLTPEQRERHESRAATQQARAEERS
jgi:hypothetical protein